MCFKKQEHTIRLLTSLLEKNKQQNIFLAENTFYNVLGQKVWRLSDQRTHLCPWRKKLLSHKTENWALLARSSTVVAKWIFSLYCEQFYQVFGKCRNMLCFTYLPYLLRPEYILALFLFFITFPSTKCPSTLACLPLPHSVVTTNLYKDYILSRPHKFCSFTKQRGCYSMKVAVSRASQGPSGFKSKVSEQEEKHAQSPEWQNKIYSLGQLNNPEVPAIPGFCYEYIKISWTQLPAWSACLALSLQISHLQSSFE